MADYNYEDLFEMLNNEKFSTDLKPLKIDDLKKIKEYINAKKQLLEKLENSDSFLDVKKKDKLKRELESAFRVLKDLFEKREQKVINRTIFCSRSGFKLKDSSNMIAMEEALYFGLIELLKIHNKEFFETFDKNYIFEEPKELKKDVEVDTKTGFVKFVEDVPELVDSELKKHGPFEAGAESNLPNELVEVLVDQGKVELLKNESSESD
jgi:DNA replication initiation complex subunit (GINS family)